MQSFNNISCLMSVRRWAAGVGLLVLGLLSLSGRANSAHQNNVPLTLPANRPLTFEANQGQFGPEAKFVARGAAYCLSLTPTEVRVQLQKSLRPPEERATDPLAARRQSHPMRYANLKIELVGANPAAEMHGLGTVSRRANYFVGSDPTQWRVNVPAYERVRVLDVYPGINLLHYGNQRQLEYDFEIAPGVDPRVIRLQMVGADEVRLSEQGELIVKLGVDEIRQPRPVIYQLVGGQRREISGGYQVLDNHSVGFSLGEYDPTHPLVIDPVVSYSAYFDAVGDDRLWAVAVGPEGDLFLAGETLTTSQFSTPGAFQTNLAGTFGGVGDAFVSRHKNNSSLTDVYVTYLGGVADEIAFALAVDDDGNAYVTGYTASTNFPTLSPVQTNITGNVVPGFTVPPIDCFVTKIGPGGSNLVFSTFYGGNGSGLLGEGDDIGRGIALDAARNVYVVGHTLSTNFPARNTSFTNAAGLEDGFILKLDAAGTNVLYASYLGGTNRDYALDVAVDAGGNPLIIGYTASINFPVTTNAYQFNLNQSTNATFAEDAFLVRLQAASGALEYGTFVGGTNNERAVRLAVDATGAAYLTGWTTSGDFPRTATNILAPVISNSIYADAFVTKLTPALTQVDYSIVFGGDGQDLGWDIAVDHQGNAHVTGETASLNFPTNNYSGILLGVNSGGIDAFLAEIDSTGTAFNYSAYLGGAQTDRGYGVTVDAAGNSYFIGETIFGTLPIGLIPGNTDVDGYIVKMVVPTSLLITNPGPSEVLVSWLGYSPEFLLQSRTNLLGTNAWTTVTNAVLFTNGFHQVSVPASSAPAFFRLVK